MYLARHVLGIDHYSFPIAIEPKYMAPKRRSNAPCTWPTRHVLGFLVFVINRVWKLQYVQTSPTNKRWRRCAILYGILGDINILKPPSPTKVSIKVVGATLTYYFNSTRVFEYSSTRVLEYSSTVVLQTIVIIIIDVLWYRWYKINLLSIYYIDRSSKYSCTRVLEYSSTRVLKYSITI